MTPDTDSPAGPAAEATAPNGPVPPNIVLILADDMGFSDIGCFGSEVPTPNIDKIANQGVLMTEFYNGARCSPSRASLLTGLYAQQSGVGHLSEFGADNLPGYRGRLNENCVTIAEVLHDAGYQTGMVGKWHVGGRIGWDNRHGFDVSGNLHPMDRGFDEFWGTLNGAGSYFTPGTLMDGRRNLGGRTGKGFYYTDEIGARSATMVERMARSGRPFFAYVAHVAPHWPLHAPEADIEEVGISYSAGWGVTRQRRHEALRSAGLVNRKWAISPSDEGVVPWEEVSGPNWEAERMKVYAAQVMALDRAVGRVLSGLDRAGAADNTIVMFMSDNGACAETLGPELPTRFLSQANTRSGEAVTVGNTAGLRPGGDATFMSYGHSWAHVSNSPFRLYKHWVHEGGISTPFVARWPRGGARGHVVHEPMHFVDVLATCVDVGNAHYPAEYNGHAIVPVEGQSFRSVLEGNPSQRVGAIFWEHEGNRAVRLGDLKLVAQAGRPWEMYRMDQDRTETVDVSARYGIDVRMMESLWLDWARRSLVVPWADVVSQLTPYYTF
jgi:arylsulfatase